MVFRITLCVSVEHINSKVRQGRRRGRTTSFWNASHKLHISPGDAPSPAFVTPLQTQAVMLSVVRSCLLPAVKLYLFGLKVLLVQLFSRPFRLPGQFSLIKVSHSVTKLYFSSESRTVHCSL